MQIESDQPTLPGIPNSTEIGWTPGPDGISQEEWLELAINLQIYDKAIWWVAGDLMNFGEDNYGEEVYQAYLQHYEPATIRRAKEICRFYPLDKRRPHVSIWKHEIMKAASPEVRDELLDAANDLEEGGMTAKEMWAERERREQREAGGGRQAEKVDATECPACGAPSSAWTKPPAELSSTEVGAGGAMHRQHLRAI